MLDKTQILIAKAIGVLVIILALILGTWAYGEHKYAMGKADCKAAVATTTAKETTRQADANREAQTSALIALPSMLATQFQLQTTITENDAQAAKDPDADACGLSAAGSVRVFSIRRPAAKP